MKKFAVLLAIIIAGCAPYKMQRGAKPYDAGYVVARDNYVIPEYTLGKDSTVPEDPNLANERFERRKNVVEDYYKRMGKIENRFKEAFLDYPILIAKFFTGPFRLPYVAYSEYRYAHDPKYKAMADKRDQEKEAEENARMKRLQDALNNYVQKDLSFEETKQPEEKITKKKEKKPKVKKERVKKAKVVKIKPEAPKPIEPAPEVIKTQQAVQQEIKPKAEKVKKIKPVAGKPEAIIIAKPLKGFSPLTVHFIGAKSRSLGSRIIAYEWDFGDGDTSKRPNPVNTFYSGSFEPKEFIVTLTVWDNNGNTSSSGIAIHVLNR